MAPAKTLYVREDDMATWQEAEEVAKKTRQSVSTFVAHALRQYLATHPTAVSADEDGMRTIVVEDTDNEEPIRRSFRGRWLVEPHPDDTRSADEGDDAGTYWGVALTVRGRIAVWTGHCNERWPGKLDSFDDLDDAASTLPSNIFARAKAALGENYIVPTDI